jgi:hypothetical protein
LAFDVFRIIFGFLVDEFGRDDSLSQFHVSTFDDLKCLAGYGFRVGHDGSPPVGGLQLNVDADKAGCRLILLIPKD